MIRGVVGTWVLALVAAWWFSPQAEGATEEALLLDESILELSLPEPKQEVLRRPSSDDPPAWVSALPTSATQQETSADERGVNPCWTPDPGFGNYDAWDRSPSVGQMLVPKDLKLDARGGFPAVFHFHGHEPARKEWVQAVDDAVLVGIDLGINSGPYLDKFASADEIERLVKSVERGVAERLGVPRARIRKLAVSSWSAGYGAVERILRSYLAGRVDAVMLLDGLHTSSADSPRAQRVMAPFVDFARRAAEGRALMYVSHSSIVPPGYASTTETASYLVWQVGGEPTEPSGQSALAEQPLGLQLIREYSDGGFHVQGFSGNGKLDHCAHVGLFRSAVREYLAPRWGLRLSDTSAE